MAGLRRGDVLRLRLSNLHDDGIHVRTSKTVKRLVFEWDDAGELRAKVASELASLLEDSERLGHSDPVGQGKKRGIAIITSLTRHEARESPCAHIRLT